MGFETLSAEGLRAQGKRQNLGRDYGEAVRRLHDLGVMVNASFVFGFDDDDASVFDRTVEWAIGQGIETATFHILTPYPGRRSSEGWRRTGGSCTATGTCYDTRHAVFRPARIDPRRLEEGYWRAYRDFYRWGSILRARPRSPMSSGGSRHAAYAIGWKKCEPVWDILIRARRVARALPLLERVLAAERHRVGAEPASSGVTASPWAAGSLP